MRFFRGSTTPNGFGLRHNRPLQNVQHRTRVHCPPRAVRMPRAFNASASPLELVTPLAWSCLMIGKVFAAKASAARLFAALPSAPASGRFVGLPAFQPVPAAFLAASAALSWR
jgi:hypothetical protein